MEKKYLTINGKQIKHKRTITERLNEVNGEIIINNYECFSELFSLPQLITQEHVNNIFEIYKRFQRPIPKIIKDVLDIGEYFDKERYFQYLKYRNDNPKDVTSEKVNILKYGLNGLIEQKQKLKERITPYNVEFWLKKGFTHDDSLEKIRQYKKNKSTSLDSFIVRWGKEIGIEKYEIFKNTSKHTKEKYVDKYGLVDGENRWNDYLEKKKITSPRTVNYWKEQGYNDKDAEKLRKEFHEKNFNTSSVDFWINKGLCEDDAIKKVKEIFEKKTVTFGRASKESLKIFNTFTENLLLNGYQVRIGINGNHELSIYNKNHKKFYFYDFALPEQKLIIEYHGERFHPNKNRLTKNEWDNWKCYVYNKKNKEYMIFSADEKYILDQEKNNFAIENGYKILELWSGDKKKISIKKIETFLKENKIKYEN